MLSKAQEIKDILKHFNRVVKSDLWSVNCIAKLINISTQIQENLYEVSFNNYPITRGFWSDLYRTPDKVFFGEEYISKKLMIYGFIKIRCELRKNE